MIGHNIPQIIEPEPGKGGKNFSLLRDRLIHHHIEGGNAVGGHHQQIFTQIVKVADFAPVQQVEGGEVGLMNGVVHVGLHDKGVTKIFVTIGN